MANYNYYALTDIGKMRSTNEDNAYCRTNMFDDTILLLLDGMGGHQKGDVASKLSIEYISKKFEGRKAKFKNEQDMIKWFHNTLKETNKYIYNIANATPTSKGMGTTIVGVLSSNNHHIFANMGDSRCYILKDDKFFQRSKDDSYLNYLLDNGKISKEDYKKNDKKNVLTNALGVYSKFNCAIEKIDSFDKILLCSDGLYNMVELDEIKKIITTNYDVHTKCNLLIKAANDNGGKDNIGVVLCEVIK